MMNLLDTNVVVALAGTTLAVSSVVLYELWYGVARSTRPAENAERMSILLSGGLDVLTFDEDDAAVAGQTRAALEAAGAVIGPYDLLIAGQALRHEATLVTANVSEFARVPRLRWEDWTRPT